VVDADGTAQAVGPEGICLVGGFDRNHIRIDPAAGRMKMEERSGTALQPDRASPPLGPPAGRPPRLT